MLFDRDEWCSIQSSLELSPRELEVVRMACEDCSEERIAERLGVSPHTVHTHFRRVYRKLCVSSRCQLLRRVVETHLSQGP